MVLAVDAVVAFGTPICAVAIPVLVVLIALIALVVSSELVLLTALTVRPDAPVLRLWPACLVLTVRRPSHVLVALAAWAAAIGFAPALAPALLTGPVLYLCWAGATATLHPAAR